MQMAILFIVIAVIAGLFGYVIKPEWRVYAIFGLIATLCISVGGYMLLLGSGDGKRVIRVLQEGLPGVAVVREMHATGVRIDKRPQVRLVLDVTLDNGKQFPIDNRYVLPFAGYAISHGQRLRVRADRDQEDYVVIDWNAPMSSSAIPTGDAESRLKELESLHRKGLISEEEYRSSRERILSEL